jgi:hypothetical protein
MECIKHPEKDSLIPCFECGKSFCRICNPLKEAGQYCPDCYEKIVSKYSGKPASRKNPKKKRESRIKQLREKTTEFNTKIKDSAKATASTAASLPRKTAVGTRDYLKGRFPVTLAEKQELDIVPPLNTTWYKFVALALGGTAIWVITTFLVHQRNPLTSIGVAILVAVGVVWTFGFKNDIRVATVAAMVVLTTLVLGELGVQILVKFSVINKIDFQPVTIYSLSHSKIFLSNFLFKILVWRMLPSFIIAFLIGLWPLPKRLSWKGFGQTGVSGKGGSQ